MRGRRHNHHWIAVLGTFYGGGDRGWGGDGGDGDLGNELKFDWFGVRFVIEYTPLVFLPFLRFFDVSRFHCTASSTWLVPSVVVVRISTILVLALLPGGFSLDTLPRCTFLAYTLYSLLNSCAIKHSQEHWKSRPFAGRRVESLLHHSLLLVVRISIARSNQGHNRQNIILFVAHT